MSTHLMASRRVTLLGVALFLGNVICVPFYQFVFAAILRQVVSASLLPVQAADRIAFVSALFLTAGVLLLWRYSRSWGLASQVVVTLGTLFILGSGLNQDLKSWSLPRARVREWVGAAPGLLLIIGIAGMTSGVVIGVIRLLRAGRGVSKLGINDRRHG